LFEDQITNRDTTIATTKKGAESMMEQSQVHIKKSQDRIDTLERENKSLQALSIQERQSVINEMQLLKMTNINMEQQLKDKNSIIDSLKQENQALQTASKDNTEEASKMITTLESLLQSKTSEIKLLKQNMNYVLKSESRKKRKLEKDNKRLKREIKEESTKQVDIQDEAVDINSLTPSEDDERENKKRKSV
jgi:hypothetical protein